MKKIIFILIIAFPIFASAQKPFELGKDKFETINFKLEGYQYRSIESTFDDVLIKDVVVNDYRFKDTIGTLILLFGDDVLYAVKFVSERGREYKYVDEKLWDKYKFYWEL